VQTICDCIGYLLADDAKFIGILSDENTLSSLVYVPYKNVQINSFLKLTASICKSVYYGRNINHNYAYAYYLHYTKLENVKVIKDLGVKVRIPELCFTLSEDKQSVCNAGDHKEKFYVLIRGSFCFSIQGSCQITTGIC